MSSAELITEEGARAGEVPQARPPAPAPAEADPPVTVIEPRPGWRVIDLRELWRYRELLYFLTWRDIKVRYKQTVLGAAWAVLQPLATTAVFVLFIGRMAGAAAGVEHYPLFVLAGLIPWTFFANAVNSAGGSVVGGQNLVTKIYFPRLLIPTGAVAAGAVDLLIAFSVLLVFMLLSGVAPGWGALALPLVLLLIVAAALGVGCLLAALTVTYRDFRHVVPFTVQLWMFATPSIYLGAGAVGPRAELLLPLNPLYGLVLNFRAAVLGGPLNWYALGVSGAVAAGLLVLGTLYFRRAERRFADVI
ncbi:MAG TPA: ABC transporter permease [Gemmataceae bacterium]